MKNAPTTTYRIQFHKQFTFADLERQIPYLIRLGIDAIYASPVFKAVPGSMHGYDQTDPLQINPELGTLGELKRVAQKLSAAGIGWIQDIVPNHMALHPDNRWLWDVLEKGPDSQFRHFFDMHYAASDYFGERPMLPVLDAPLEEAINDDGVTVGKVNDRYVLEFAGQSWPINAAGLALIHRQPSVTPARLNADKALIHELVGLQYYEPCSWRETNSRINYRRFFTVNGLIATNVQDNRVFRRMHRFIAELVKSGIFTGLRIDHVDGLSDPTGYLLRLRKLVGENTYVIVEKILQHDESLPLGWPVQGTTGYEFLAMANGVLTDMRSERQFSRFYQRIVRQNSSMSAALWQAKHDQLYGSMSGELNNLAAFFCNSVLTDGAPEETIDESALKSAIALLVIHCPVYRWYGRTFPLTDTEADAVRETLQRAAVETPELRKELTVLERLLVPPTLTGSKRWVGHISEFYRRCMQLSGALMAKGLEDTLMYTYNRYIGANEVGSTPAAFGCSVEDFHRFMKYRQRHWPLSLNATATHDTKRGEDVRARLQVITAFPRLWDAAVKNWRKWNAPFKTRDMPDVNDEYFIYQTLWGTFPMPGQSLTPYRNRLEAYLVKALREAKRHTNWVNPNPAYEKAVIRFIRRMLRADAPFLKHFRALHASLLDGAIWNSLAQVVLKFTCPGVPDIYQGSEGWDLSFVDPDNRRPVDFETRHRWQEASLRTDQFKDVVGDLWRSRTDGQLKYFVMERLAQLRLSHRELFLSGIYEPLAVAGKYRKHILSFVRRLADDWLLVAVPRCIGQNIMDDAVNMEHIDWKDTRIPLPQGAPKRWRNIITDEECYITDDLLLSTRLRQFPMGVWVATETKRSTGRAAGVLLPLFSLPADFGMGDLGSGAYWFADFLQRAGQRYWLMLPHNPTDSGVAYSPYSARSAFAGNTLLISLEAFAEQGWLISGDLDKHRLPAALEVSYDSALAVKSFFFGIAFRNYLRQWEGMEDAGFKAFCERETQWLDDYAHYVVLKDIHQDQPWYTWPRPYRSRDKQAIEELSVSHGYEIQKVKWLQYQFYQQWSALKAHCQHLGIHLMGDLPFYVNHDAADVWAHPELFCLDGTGQLAGMAGVPPDYFNADGQSWGMPVYRWENHVKQGFAWWVQRIEKNLAMYDILRLDHFRAFYDYWEIPKGAKTAKEGRWKEGPGMALFNAVKAVMGNLPFVAEDLGDIHEGIYQFRDELGIPGMKVLQFAFGGDVGTNIHAPHHHSQNDVVFTGTHDNNTVAGWYGDDLTAEGKRQLQAYLGMRSLTPRRTSETLCRMAYASPASLAILPLQDVLKLGREARMNIPAKPDANWKWRLDARLLTSRVHRRLAEWVAVYGR
ncbi:4-alpha-glucanotransferase/malto-oligosyltrehalose synthase,TIGR02401 [Parapedobacter composti]|uniref:4-alpha-glucanotransferase n=1 Tax=Parapedobacter composti TaxID=623281 RepID=A0A1I1IGB4_9SPHI|nr:malto-oligosyltrehalose synthase [Parapedobacter composti]SFC35334.1 4-alpha-glucanotransferase/malto-oligosyltrehalose synthase,TIGR02401 [Parapedobacter composti]